MANRFSGAARHHIFTIAPHAPFLATLAERICDGTLLYGWELSGPFGLSDVTIILPTRRARLALAEAFQTRLGGAALLPDIRTFGGVPEEEEPFLPPFDAKPIQPSISPLRRTLILAQLVEKWVRTAGRSHRYFTGFSNPPSPGEILSLAESLGDLIDDCHVEMADPARLVDVDPADESGYWQETLKFLDIALKAWPDVLESRGEIDAAAARNLRLARQAEAARLIYADRPVIAAGTTGSIPATAGLLQAIADLPRGVLVLPGLDTSIDASEFSALTNPETNPFGHPQYGLARLLSRLGVAPEAVTELAPDAPTARTAIVREALAPAEDTGAWPQAKARLEPEFPAALAGVSIVVARTQEDQARAIALAAREALETGKSVGVVSPDRGLARRIAAELARFDVGVDDSAGTPLFQSRTGRYVRQLLALAKDLTPVALMGVLRNRQTALGEIRARLTATADLIELGLLRGQRPAPGFGGLRALLQRNAERVDKHVPLHLDDNEIADVAALLDRLERALSPLTELFAGPPFAVEAFARALEATLCAFEARPDDDPVAQTPDRRAFAQWLEMLRDESGPGPDLGRSGIEAALEALMSGVVVRSVGAGYPGISIWGLLEARLQGPDLMILAGLNEGVWPEAADPGPWLSRKMALTIGLEPPERRQGQAAHDFEMAVGTAEVLMARSDRIGTAPAIPSRLLQRIEAFVGGAQTESMRARGRIWVERARALDFVGPVMPAPRPAPNPAIALRPRSLSVTEIETLVRSPYDLYAKYVLRLRRLDPLGDDPDARERGTLIHSIFGRYIEEGNDPASTDALDTLLAIANDEFTSLDALPERRILWFERFRGLARGFLEFERQRAAEVVVRHAEIDGRWSLPLHEGAFALRGRADRIDVMADGDVEILDFKTGGIPRPQDMKAFDAPQLLLEALMVREGGFGAAKVPAANARALTYLKLGFGPEALKKQSFKLPDAMSLTDAVDEVGRRLSRHVDAYLFNATPMAARVYPDPNARHAGDYDHLARTGEWTTIDGEGDEQ